jgi:hypothetical protein
VRGRRLPDKPRVGEEDDDVNTIAMLAMLGLGLKLVLGAIEIQTHQ